MSTRLFAYGTLRQGIAPTEIAEAVRQLRRIGPGIAQGRLYDLGEYPGAVFEAEADAIPGEVYELPSQDLWRELDSYEGFYQDQPAASLFVRREIEVYMTNTGATAVCWVYEYNRPIGATQETAQPHA